MSTNDDIIIDESIDSSSSSSCARADAIALVIDLASSFVASHNRESSSLIDDSLDYIESSLSSSFASSALLSDRIAELESSAATQSAALAASQSALAASSTQYASLLSSFQSQSSSLSTLSAIEESFSLAQSRLREYASENASLRSKLLTDASDNELLERDGEICALKQKVESMEEALKDAQEEKEIQAKGEEMMEAQIMDLAAKAESAQLSVSLLNQDLSDSSSRLQHLQSQFDLQSELLLSGSGSSGGPGGCTKAERDELESRLRCTDDKLKLATQARMEDFNASGLKRSELQKMHQSEIANLWDELRESNGKLIRAEGLVEKYSFELSIGGGGSAAGGSSGLDESMSMQTPAPASKTQSRLAALGSRTVSKLALGSSFSSSASANSASSASGQAQIGEEGRKRLAALSALVESTKLAHAASLLRIKALDRELLAARQSLSEAAIVSAQLAESKSENSKLQGEVNSNKDKMVALRKEVASSASKVESASKMAKLEMKSLEKGKADLKAAAAKSREVAAKLIATTADKNGLDRELALAKKKLGSLECIAEKLKTSEAATKVAASAAAVSEQRACALAVQIAQAHESHKLVNARFADREAEFIASATQNSEAFRDVKKAHDSLVGNKAELEFKLCGASSKCSGLEDELRGVRAEKAEVVSNLHVCDTSRALLAKRFAQSEANLVAAGEQATSLRTAITTKDDSILSAASLAKNLADKNKQLSADMKAEYQKLLAKHDAQVKKVGEVESALKVEKKSRLSETKLARDELRRSQAERAEVESSLAESESTSSERRRELESLSSRHALLETKHSAESNTAKRNSAAQLERYASLLDGKTDVESQLIESKNECDDISSAKDELARLHDLLQDERTKLQAALALLRVELSGVQGSLKSTLGELSSSVVRGDCLQSTVESELQPRIAELSAEIVVTKGELVETQKMLEDVVGAKEELYSQHESLTGIKQSMDCALVLADSEVVRVANLHREALAARDGTIAELDARRLASEGLLGSTSVALTQSQADLVASVASGEALAVALASMTFVRDATRAQFAQFETESTSRQAATDATLATSQANLVASTEDNASLTSSLASMTSIRDATVAEFETYSAASTARQVETDATLASTSSSLDASTRDNASLAENLAVMTASRDANLDQFATYSALATARQADTDANLASTASSLESATVECASLTSSLAAMTSDRDCTASAFSAHEVLASERQSATEATLAQTECTLAQTQNSVASLSAELASSESALASSNASGELLTTSLAELTLAHSDLSIDFEQFKADSIVRAEVLAGELASVEKSLDDFAGNNASLTAALGDMTARRDTIVEEFAQHKEEASELQASTQASLEQTESTLLLANASNVAVSAELVSMTAIRDTIMANFAAFQIASSDRESVAAEELANVESALDGSASEVAQLTSTIANLTASCDATSLDVAQRFTDASALQASTAASLASTQAQLGASDSDNASLNASIVDLTNTRDATLIATESHVESLNSTILAGEQLAASLTSELASAHSAHDASNASHADRECDFSASSAHAADALRAITAQHDLLETTKVELESTIVSAEAKAARLEQDLLVVRSEKVDVESTLSATEASLADLEGRFATCEASLVSAGELEASLRASIASKDEAMSFANSTADLLAQSSAQSVCEQRSAYENLASQHADQVRITSEVESALAVEKEVRASESALANDAAIQAASAHADLSATLVASQDLCANRLRELEELAVLHAALEVRAESERTAAASHQAQQAVLYAELLDGKSDVGSQLVSSRRECDELTQSKDELSIRYESLADDRSKLNVSLASVRVELIRTQSSLKSVQTDLAESVVREDALQTNVQTELQPRIDQLGAEIAATKSELGETQSMLLDVVGAKEELHSRHATLSGLKQSMDCALVLADAEIARVAELHRATVAKLDGAIADATTDRLALEVNLALAKSSLSNSCASLVSAQADAVDAKVTIASMVTAREVLEASHAQSQLESALREGVFGEKLSLVELKLVVSTSEVASLNTNLVELTASRDASLAEYAAFKVESSDRESVALASIRDSASANRLVVDDLKSQIERQSAELVTAGEWMDTLDQEGTESKAAHAQLLIEYNAKQKESDELLTRYNDKQKESDQWEENCDVASSKITKLEDDIASARDTVAKFQVSAQRRFTTLESELAQREDRAKRSVSIINQITEQRDALAKELASVESKLTSASSTGSELADKVKSMEQHIAQRDTDLTTADANVIKYRTRSEKLTVAYKSMSANEVILKSNVSQLQSDVDESKVNINGKEREIEDLTQLLKQMAKRKQAGGATGANQMQAQTNGNKENQQNY